MKTYPAGEELNALLHEHLFGGRIFTRDEMFAEASRVWEEQPGCHEFLMGFSAWWVNRKVYFKQKMPNYLTGDGMLLVIAAMHKAEWSCSVACGSGDDVYYAEFTKHIEGREYVRAQRWNEHAPTAVGQSALLALGVIKEG